MYLFLAIFIAFLVGWAGIAVAIAWQVNRYLPALDSAVWILRFFYVGGGILIVISFVLFFFVPWNILF